MEPSEVRPAAHVAASVQLTLQLNGLSSIQAPAIAQTQHQMEHTASRQLSALHGQMEHSLLCPVLAKLSAQTSLPQHGLHAVQQRVIHPQLANIAQAT
jgi:hypothetical protein